MPYIPTKEENTKHVQEWIARKYAAGWIRYTCFNPKEISAKVKAYRNQLMEEYRNNKGKD